MNIGIFGGSFNPIHYGHVKMARAAIDELNLDKLIVIPASESPFKIGSSLKKLPWDRLEMVRDAFSAVEKATVDEREINRGGVSYAIDTVREIASENPDAKLYFIVGEDCRADLEKWKDFSELVKICEFKVFPRTEENSTLIREAFISNGVIENPDEKTTSIVRSGLRRKEGFCPCRLAKTPENFCPCEEFRNQLSDSQYHGFCHCRLYLKP